MRSNNNDAADFISSLRGYVSQALQDALRKHGITDSEAETEYANSVILSVLYEWGGDQPYIPLKSPELNVAIYEAIQRGEGASSLARKYRVSYSSIYKIYHRERDKRRIDQAALPGVE